MAYQQSFSSWPHLSKPVRLSKPMHKVNVYSSKPHRLRHSVDVSRCAAACRAIDPNPKIHSTIYLSIPQLRPFKRTSQKTTKRRTTTYLSSKAAKRAQGVAIAGTTVTLAAAGALQSLKLHPLYEGHIQLVGILPTSVTGVSATVVDQGALSTQVITELANPNIAPPDLVNAVQSSIVNNPHMATAVTQQLKQKGVLLNSRVLLNQLQATTSPEGWLELEYQNTDPDQVHQVLEHVAQWYVDQELTCESQACRDLPFIESQIPILRQQQAQVQQAIATLEQTIQDKARSIPQGNVANQAKYVSVQVREQARQMARIEDAMTDAMTRLYHLQTEMNLEGVEIHTGLALLHQVLPDYRASLAEWQHHDLFLMSSALPLDSSLPLQQLPEAQALSSQQQTRLDRMETMVAGSWHNLLWTCLQCFEN